MDSEEYKHDHLDRTGMWLFASIASLDDLEKQHDIVDDLESFFWVLLYTIIFRPTNTDDHKQDTMNFFTWREEEYCNGMPTGRFVGGVRKAYSLYDLLRTVEFRCRPLETLVVGLLAIPLLDYNYARTKYEGCEAMLKYDPSNIKHVQKYEASRQKRDESLAQVGDPSWWIEMFNTALGMDGWIDDAVTDGSHSTKSDQHVNHNADQSLVMLPKADQEDQESGSNVDFSPLSNPNASLGKELLHLVAFLSSYVLVARLRRSPKSHPSDSVDSTSHSTPKTMAINALKRHVSEDQDYCYSRKRRKVIANGPPIPGLSLPEVPSMASQDEIPTDNRNISTMTSTRNDNPLI